MDQMWKFAGENPVTAFFMVWVVGWVLTTPFNVAFRVYNRRLRHKNILANGWPTAPIDADGDVVYQDKED